jgi:transcriptional regulator GlxA family with amidase domain
LALLPEGRSAIIRFVKRSVWILGFPGAQVLDVTGPAEVFSMADRLKGGGAYEVKVIAPGGRPFATSGAVTIAADGPLPSRASVDTLVVAGGTGVQSALGERALMGWLRRAAGRARRVASVCNGAFLLAEAGLLDDRRATTHWAVGEELQRRYPEVQVDTDPIFVRDGHVYTSAGVTAGMDLALALVEEDLGRDTALEVARWLVLFVKRPGGQSQFSAQLASQLAERHPLRELQAWIVENPAEDLSVPALAGRACMSERNFARAFRREVGMTPGAYVEAVRVDRARMLLEASDAPIEAVATDCGFGSVETMRRAFARRVRVSPSDYRGRFRAA